MENIDEISKKILYLIANLNVKQSEIIEIYKKNKFNIARTLNSETFKNEKYPVAIGE